MDPDDFLANFWETLFSPSATDQATDLNVESEQVGKLYLIRFDTN